MGNINVLSAVFSTYLSGYTLPYEVQNRHFHVKGIFIFFPHLTQTYSA